MRKSLRASLEALGIPQRQFAMLVGVDYATVKRWVSGDAGTPICVLLIARALEEGIVTRQWIEQANRGAMLDATVG